MKSMTNKPILYNGSLAELNSHSRIQYKFAPELRFSTEQRLECDVLTELDLHTKYDGLVNVRTSFIPNTSSGEGHFVEGTPIIVNKRKNKKK